MARGQNINSMVFNKPLLVTLDALQPITDYLSDPERAASLKLERPEEESLLKLESFNSEDEYQKYKLQKLGINPETMVGILDVSGSLVYRAGQMNANCTELTSYEGLKKQAEQQIEAGAKTLVLKVDSGGGMAHGMFSAANHIKKIAKQSGVKTVSYIDGTSASAAFGLSVLSDEIIAHPQSQIGSVGVVIALHNDSKMLDNLGIKRQFIFAGANKIPFDNSTGEFTDKFLDDLQKSVDKTYKSFVQHVAMNRGLTEEAVTNTNASMFDTDEALALGLIDKVMELEDFELEYGLKTSNNKTTGFNQYLESPVEVTKLTHEDNMSQQLTVEAVQAQLSAALEEKQTLADTLSGVQSQLAELTEAKESLSTELTALKEAKESLVAEKAALEAEKLATEKQARLDSRTAKLEASLGKDNEKVAELLTTTESLSDEQFEVIASSFGVAQEAKQDQFAEKGGEGQQSNTQLTIEQKLAAKAKSMNKQSA